MTKSEFIKIADEDFNEAVGLLSQECDEIWNDWALEDLAKNKIDEGDYWDAYDICKALADGSFSGYWVYDGISEPISVDEIEDVEEYLDGDEEDDDDEE